MSRSINPKSKLFAELNERARELWGSVRAKKASRNIKEAADHIYKVNNANIDSSEPPLFHPPLMARMALK